MRTSRTSPFVCAHCAPMNDWHFDWARSAYLTQGQVSESVVGFKYEEQFFRRSQIGRLADRGLRPIMPPSESWDALVPVPLYHRRLRTRGFNQAEELARGLGRRRGDAVSGRASSAAARRLPKPGLKRNARRENMRNAFALKGGFDVANRNLLLIDDVFTTGATTNACAERPGPGRGGSAGGPDGFAELGSARVGLRSSSSHG